MQEIINKYHILKTENDIVTYYKTISLNYPLLIYSITIDSRLNKLISVKRLNKNKYENVRNRWKAIDINTYSKAFKLITKELKDEDNFQLEKCENIKNKKPSKWQQFVMAILRPLN